MDPCSSCDPGRANGEDELLHQLLTFHQPLALLQPTDALPAAGGPDPQDSEEESFQAVPCHCRELEGETRKSPGKTLAEGRKVEIDLFKP